MLEVGENKSTYLPTYLPCNLSIVVGPHTIPSMGGDASEFNSKQHCKFVTPPGFVSLGSPLKETTYNLQHVARFYVASRAFATICCGDPNPRHIILD